MPFPAVVDNTMRKTFAHCPQKFYNEFILCLRENKSIDLFFGVCFAKGMEVARKMFYQRSEAGAAPLSANDAVEEGVKAAREMFDDFPVPFGSLKTKDRLVGAIRYYFETWPLEKEWLVPVKDGIECCFAFDLPIAHPDSGWPIRYAGRYDLRANLGPRYYVNDEKTASRLGDLFAWQWDMDSQMTGYIWSVYQDFIKQGDIHNLPEVQGNVRAVSILKQGYGHMEVPIVRSHWQLDEWYRQLLRDVRRMVACYNEGNETRGMNPGVAWDKAMHSNACVSFGRQCEYTRLCLSPNPERLYDGYQRVVWNPLVRGTE